MTVQVTNEMIAAAWAAWKSRHRERMGPGPAFVEAIQAALEAMPPRPSFYSLPDGEPVGPVFINGVPYVRQESTA